MKSRHTVIFENAKAMSALPSGSVDLVVTSPPYPMIDMWDDVFTFLDPGVGKLLKKSDGPAAFQRMHQVLDGVWDELFRVLTAGGIACINIGDATRTLAGNFSLYTNHARILTYCQHIGFSSLPAILWRKQTNAPNKFMGSGMMPPGAYVTLEHEYVLVLRKGAKRDFPTPRDKLNRRESTFFWEERNLWFSDVWMDLKGTVQRLTDKKLRTRSGAFPFELAYRLVNMFSVKGDTVLDPFMGTGTTMCAAAAAGRNSAGFEIDDNFGPVMGQAMSGVVAVANRRIQDRLENHLRFARERVAQKGGYKYLNAHYRFPVVTRQEKELLLNPLLSAAATGGGTFTVDYADTPHEADVGRWNAADAPMAAPVPPSGGKRRPEKGNGGHGPEQRNLFN